MAVKLEESGRIIPGCVHTHEIPVKSHPLLLSLACQAKLGRVKHVCHGSISLDDCGGQKLEVVRQAGTGLFTSRSEHLVF